MPQAVPPDIVKEVEFFASEPEPNASPIIVPADAEAQQILADYSCRVHEIMNQSDRDRNMKAALYGKAIENARKVALTIAVGKNHIDPVITAADMAYGVALVDYSLRQVFDIIESTMAENEHERSMKRLLLTIREAGPAGILRSDLTRKSQYLKKTLRDECLVDLIDARQVVVETLANGSDRFNFMP